MSKYQTFKFQKETVNDQFRTWIFYVYNNIVNASFTSVLGVQLIGKQRAVVVYIRTNLVLVWSAGCNTTATITSHSKHKYHEHANSNVL